MTSNRRVLLIAGLAALAGGAASVYFEPTIARRLAATESGQRVLGAVLGAKVPEPPAGTIVAERGGIVREMTLSSLTGENMSVPRAWAGKPTLVNFWATWCAPCLKEMPELQAFAGKQGASGTRVVGIALDDPVSVQTFLREHAITYPILVDAPGPADASVRLGNPSGVLPYTVLISADGRLLKTRIGPFDDETEIADWTKP